MSDEWIRTELDDKESKSSVGCLAFFLFVWLGYLTYLVAVVIDHLGGAEVVGVKSFTELVAEWWRFMDWWS